MKIYDFKDPDVFKKLEKMAYTDTLDVSKFPPAAYKYFSELIKLYREFKGGKVSEQDAKASKAKLYADYNTAMGDYQNWITVYRAYQDNIKLAGTALSDIEKSKTAYEIAKNACDVIGVMTGDHEFCKRQMKKLNLTREEFISLIGKDVIVDYPFNGELQKWSMKNFTYDAATDTIKHNRITGLICETFLKNARNPHVNDEATHG